MNLSFRRKKYIINPRFQYSIILKFIGLALVNNILFYFTVSYFFWDFKKQAISLGLREEHIFFSFISQLKYDFGTLFLIVSVVSLFILFVSGVLISNKIAGPLHRLTEDLNSMNSLEDSKEITFRNKDYFVELKDSFNSFLKRIK